MNAIQELATSCRVAHAHSPVYKQECVYTFCTPHHLEGLLVSLQHWTGTCQALAMQGSAPLEKGLFCRIVKKRVLKAVETTDENEAAPAAPTKLGLGVQGGFPSAEDKYEDETKVSVVVLEAASAEGAPPTIVAEVPYDETSKKEFPLAVSQSVDSILNHVGVATQQDVTAFTMDEDVPVSKYAADLPFVDNGILIDPDPATWKCQHTPDSTADGNVWLNLSDGFLGGGRRHWDGSGGTNGALEHYNETGKQYPLVVKLGTITADLETADCYSYASDEDGPVKIPNLAELLEKRGIKVASLQKTVKSTAELEVELNANYAFDAITEAGAELVPVSGPGLQGLQNLGNSCYMNSILQMLFSIPEMAKRYGHVAVDDHDHAISIGIPAAVKEHPLLQGVSPQQAPDKLLVQTAKVAVALTSGAYAKPVAQKDDHDHDDSMDPKYRLAPRMFKHVVGKDHVDFRTGQQQDAAHYFQYLLERLDRAEQAVKSGTDDAIVPSSHLFSFESMARLTCATDEKIKYQPSAPETLLSLRIPMDKATVAVKPTAATSGNAVDAEVTSPEQKRLKGDDDDKEPVPSIALETCLDEWASETVVEGLRWPHLHNATASAQQKVGFSTFPRYLLIQMQRYQLGPDWTPIKLQVELQVPPTLDLTRFGMTGPADGEDLVPPEDATATAAAPAAPPVFDEAALSQLMDMGFSINSCKRALKAVGGANVEAAMGWVFEHNTDPDFNDPLPEDGDAMDTTDASGVDEGVVQSLVGSLGCFTAEQVRAALGTTNGAPDRAADWLFSHMDDLDGAIAALTASSEPAGSSDAAKPKIPLDTGEGKYKLVGMVSHIGKHTGSGHYVAHLLKDDDKWVIFNDEKVALSSEPPFAHAYLYLYQRIDSMGHPDPNY